MSVDLALNEIYSSFCILLKYDKCNLEADVASYVNTVAQIDLIINIHSTSVHNF